jgi:hypothetical protein
VKIEPVFSTDPFASETPAPLPTAAMVPELTTWLPRLPMIPAVPAPTEIDPELVTVLLLFSWMLLVVPLPTAAPG